MTDIPTPVAAADLPVTGYVSDHQLAGPWAFAVISPVERLGEDETALTPLAAAQSQLDALREEVARLTRERDAAVQGRCRITIPTETMEQAFQSHFKRGYAAALKAQPTDVDALMALADEYARADVCCVLTAETADWHENNRIKEAAREALRAKLAARKEPRTPMTPDEIHDRITELKDLLP